jgi:hypothetical protein
MLVVNVNIAGILTGLVLCERHNCNPDFFKLAYFHDYEPWIVAKMSKCLLALCLIQKLPVVANRRGTRASSESSIHSSQDYIYISSPQA